jgi:site-specific recombinase XerD
VLPISDYLYERLWHRKKNADELIFCQPLTGRMHSSSSASDYWNNFKRALDIQMGAKVYRNKIVQSVVAEDLVAYCLRHTYCTDLQRAGVPINVAKYLMGHSDISVTSKIYTSMTPDVIDRAKESMDDFYSRL